MIDGCGGLARLAIATQVRTDHGMAGLVQQRGDLVPRGCGAWMAVKQEEGRPARGAAPDSEHDVAQVDALIYEAVEHLPTLALDTGRRPLCAG